VATAQGPALRSLAGQSVTVDVTVAGLTGRPTNVVTFTQLQLVHERNIQYLWTWTSTQMIDELLARSCFDLAFRNNEVAIFHVNESCYA
jgi:hypothetical protein